MFKFNEILASLDFNNAAIVYHKICHGQPLRCENQFAVTLDFYNVGKVMDYKPVKLNRESASADSSHDQLIGLN